MEKPKNQSPMLFSYAPIASLLFSKLPLLTHLVPADKSSPLNLSDLYLNLSDRYKLLQLLRAAIALALFCLHLLVSTFLSIVLTRPDSVEFDENRPSQEIGIGRALTQLLSLVADVPVSSRKYQLLRGLAENLMDDNVREGNGEVNRTALGLAFSKTIYRLEVAESERGTESHELGGFGERVIARVYNRAVRYARDSVGSKEGSRLSCESAEKLAAELLWLSRKLADCGGVDEAVLRWGSSSNFARLALSAEPRLQEWLVRVSVFLFKHAKETDDTEENESQDGKKMKMLMSWLPLLCRASNGTDTPVVSMIEKAEMETVLEEMIGEMNILKQEKVLALWLYHFTSCPNSDWPNLQACYAHWYAKSRKIELVK
ncbi:1,8-cineole synthase [Tasmannia lanceolata]|uniref:1,8-cineole synthase n=1 Tax=Tasmannia lanceolata TaxID=3420 RepID=UPI004063EFA3